MGCFASKEESAAARREAEGQGAVGGGQSKGNKGAKEQQAQAHVSSRVSFVGATGNEGGEKERHR